MDDRKKVSSLNLSQRWMFPLFSSHSLSSAWFYVEIPSFLSEMPEVWTIVEINLQIECIRDHKEKNGEKTAREASKRGESGSLTENGKLYRCRSFNSIFTSKIHFLKFFSEFFFVNSVK